jgi:hypothetical protein
MLILLEPQNKDLVFLDLAVCGIGIPLLFNEVIGAH